MSGNTILPVPYVTPPSDGIKEKREGIKNKKKKTTQEKMNP